MLPNPVDSLCPFVSEIPGVKIATQEQQVGKAVSVASPQLLHFGCLFFAPLVGVGEIARRFRFNEDGKATRMRLVRLNDDIDWNIDGSFDAGCDIHSKSESAHRQTRKHLRCSAGYLSIPALPQIPGDEIQLPLLLRVTDDRVRNSAAQAIGHDSRCAITFDFCRESLLLKPRKEILVKESDQDPGDRLQLRGKLLFAHTRGKLAIILHRLNQVPPDISYPRQPVPG